ncbi:MAG: sugar ABC transporter permease [Ruminococcaceae bacterium]|nr:sugar ABC transporter permease [Oscillospiraceae bacterium]
MKRSIRKWFPIFVLPTFIAFLIAFLIPFVMGLYLSFCEFRTVSDAKFVGFENYISAFKGNSDFLNALIFTVLFSLVSVITINLFGFLLALTLTRGIRGTNFFRTVFFMPNLIGGIVLGYIWQLIINGFLYNYGYSITSKWEFGFLGLIVLMNWQMIGYTMIIYIAGIQNVPDELIEAARVDGATPFKTLRTIIIPSVMPSITICLFLTITNSFKLFDQNLALTAGAPAKQTRMLALDIYSTFYGKIGYEGVGQAKAVMFFIIVATIALLQLFLTRRREVES